MTPYIETDCTITHEGQTFEAGGAYVDEHVVIGYVHCDDKSYSPHSAPYTITTWHGEPMGKAHVTRSWYSHQTHSHWYQVEATIDGVRYTGRTQGDGMIWKGKRTARQP